MNRKILIFLLITLTFSVYSRELEREQLDSLYNLYVRIHNNSLPVPLQNPVEDTLRGKCSFGTAVNVFLHFNEFTDAQQKILKELTSRPATDTSIISPSGFFRVHYNVSGPYVPQYDVSEFAKALDSSYNFEVNYLGYPPPPSDTLGGISPAEAGGDGRYDVYIVAMGDYGETDFETQLSQSPLRFTSFMQVHYSFGSGFYTHGINAARVTAAHEFHHSIQVGNYIFRNADLFFYELTSTAMEEFVYDSVNDYYNYMPDYFDYTDEAFASHSGYDLAIWNIYMKDKFGYDIIKKQWETMPDARAISAINSTLFDEGSGFGKELNRFGIWTFYTNYRAKSGEYFEEAVNYPLIHPVSSIQMNSPSVNVTVNAYPTSNNFIYFINSAESDTLTVLVTNSDLNKGIDSTQSVSPFDYYVYNYNEPGSQQLTETYYSKLITEQPTFWASSEFINGFLIREGEPPEQLADYAFPNPFRYGSNSYVYFPVSGGGSSQADLNIYTSAMELVYSVTKPFDYILGQKVLKWNGLDNKNSKVPSGVYIYITNSGDKKKIGKLVIFDE